MLEIEMWLPVFREVLESRGKSTRNLKLKVNKYEHYYQAVMSFASDEAMFGEPSTSSYGTLKELLNQIKGLDAD